MANLRDGIARTTDAKGAGLPPAAIEALEGIAASFSEKPIKAVRTPKLDPPHVRRGLTKAARGAEDDQAPAVVYALGHGEPLVVLKADDLARLLRGAYRQHIVERKGK